MPLLILLFALLALMAVAVLALPFTIFTRYRAGTARRPARAWLATINVYVLAISGSLFLITAGITSLWVPRAFTYSATGLAAGCLLGLIGLRLSRWEVTPHSLHYTPNRWLVLSITVLVTARIAYGFWRAWNAWQTASDETSWLVASGAAGSMGAGAVVLGYYLAYWFGVRHRARRHQAVTRGSFRA